MKIRKLYIVVEMTYRQGMRFYSQQISKHWKSGWVNLVICPTLLRKWVVGRGRGVKWPLDPAFRPSQSFCISCLVAYVCLWWFMTLKKPKQVLHLKSSACTALRWNFEHTIIRQSCLLALEERMFPQFCIWRDMEHIYICCVTYVEIHQF